MARNLGWINPNLEIHRALKARFTAGRVAALLPAAPEPTWWPLVIFPSSPGSPRVLQPPRILHLAT